MRLYHTCICRNLSFICLLADEVKAPNLFERAKEEIEATLHSEKSPQHHEETHGKRNDIDENTPLDAVRAPNVFERATEELEALVQTIHPKKDSPTHERRFEFTCEILIA